MHRFTQASSAPTNADMPAFRSRHWIVSWCAAGYLLGLLLIVPWSATNVTLLPLVLLAALWLSRRGRTMLAAHLVVMQLGAFTMNPLLKELFDRQRPELWEMRGQFAWSSYPSGHAIAGVASLLTFAILLRRERGWGWPFPIAIALLVVTAYSRLHLGVHWPTDVIGGLLIGAVWLGATYIAFRPQRSTGSRS